MIDRRQPTANRSQFNPKSLLEPLAMIIMAIGGLMLFQPFVQVLYSYSFSFIIFGTLLFIIVSHFPEGPTQAGE
jgi:hypothetical protein